MTITINAQSLFFLESDIDKKHTLSLGRRLMVLRGRNTLSTLRDLMVLMSFPLLLPLHTSHTRTNTQRQDTHAQTHKVRGFRQTRRARSS